ncbi:MAG: hypothetical protein JWR07_5686, partial [Nevskia sp.]|nr:hypothetical protein [Nevskia sp.]
QALQLGQFGRLGDFHAVGAKADIPAM